jgi:hypothetical protein
VLIASGHWENTTSLHLFNSLSFEGNNPYYLVSSLKKVSGNFFVVSHQGEFSVSALLSDDEGTRTE